MKINIFVAVIAIFLIGILITRQVMSAHPPVNPEEIVVGYLKKSRIDSRKTPIYDKNGKVFGYGIESLLGSRKTVVYDTNDKVKGYLEQDLSDSSKLTFFKVNDY